MNDVSLKARINNIARASNISPQASMQNFLMNRFLMRLEKSEYKDAFVVKGGMLISSIIGIDNRTTMDIDASLRNITLTESEVRKAFDCICSIQVDDGIEFRIRGIEPIRADDLYGGYRITFSGCLGKINAPMSMDVSTGDVITPDVRKHIFKDLIDDSIQFDLWTYPIETVLAEKVETILSRGILNTRPRDFYDVYKLAACDYSKDEFHKALTATSEYRGSVRIIESSESIINEIMNDKTMQKRWFDYTRTMSYAKGIEFIDTIYAIRGLLNID